MNSLQYFEKYFKANGKQALHNRFKTLVKLFNENKFPFRGRMLGFPLLEIPDRGECYGRLRELADILLIQFKIIKTTEPNGNVIEYRIEY